MERLSEKAIEIIDELHTERLDYNSEYLPLIEAVNRLAAYEKTGMEPCDYSAMSHALQQAKRAREDLTELIHLIGGVGVDRLQELAHAEQDGRLLVLPCKIGGTLWMVVQKRSKITTPYYPFVKRTYLTWLNMRRCVEEFGKTVFLTREEAEAALEGGKRDE